MIEIVEPLNLEFENYTTAMKQQQKQQQKQQPSTINQTFLNRFHHPKPSAAVAPSRTARKPEHDLIETQK
jgi:hypothetical protein